MNQDRDIEPKSQSSPQQQERWVKISLGAALLLVVAWLYFSSSNGVFAVKGPADETISTTKVPETTRPEDQPVVRHKPEVVEQRAPTRRKPATSSDPLVVRNARVTDEDGHVIHRSDVDLRPTIERIERGKRLRFSHDGSVFENRERRLPIKPSGYYREFIHPTPDDNGPGGQRVVLGREGEVYYTPDHYKTFRRVR